MDGVRLCANLFLRCELQSTRGIALPAPPRACLVLSFLRASFLFLSVCQEPERIFCHRSSWMPGSLSVPSKTQRKDSWNNGPASWWMSARAWSLITRFGCYDPTTTTCPLGERVGGGGGAITHFVTSNHDSAFGRGLRPLRGGRAELCRVCKAHTAWWMRGKKVLVLYHGSFSLPRHQGFGSAELVSGFKNVP